jgi:acyl-coenzyme A thioesterase PaaI-like protein
MQTIDDQPSTPPGLDPQSPCVVCSPGHPHGLRIRFSFASDGSVSADWTPTEAWQGFRGIIHGGIISTVLDEAMAKAVAAAGRALTGELRVRFRYPVAPGQELRIRGWIVERTRRMIKAEAALTAIGGCEHAHAWSVFLPRMGEREG